MKVDGAIRTALIDSDGGTGVLCAGPGVPSEGARLAEVSLIGVTLQREKLTDYTNDTAAVQAGLQSSAHAQRCGAAG